MSTQQGKQERTANAATACAAHASPCACRALHTSAASSPLPPHFVNRVLNMSASSGEPRGRQPPCCVAPGAACASAGVPA
jgi:hypothetical protein